MAASLLNLIRMMPAYADIDPRGGIDPNFRLALVHLDPAGDLDVFSFNVG
jgi:hypothetical protein